MSDNDAEEESNEPHVYIHILPTKTGEKFERRIVPVTTIKKFDYKAYTENPRDYKDKQFKYKNEGKKVKCFILYAADNISTIENQIASGKRFRVPTIRESIDTTGVSIDSTLNLDDNQSENNQDDDESNVKRAKLARKESKKLKAQSAKEVSDNILQKYLSSIEADDQSNASYLQEDEQLYSSAEYNPKTFTAEVHSDDGIKRSNTQTNNSIRPLGNSNLNKDNIMYNRYENHHNHSECLATIRAYKAQALFFKQKLEEAKNEVRQWKSNYEDAINSKTEIPPQSDAALLDYYDKLYQFDGPLNFSEELDCVELLHSVKCKTIAYKDAFNSSKPIELVTKLMFGIYGYEDLLTRCQRNQKGTENLQPLSEEKNETIERELYRFLRLNRYNVHLIKLELQQIDKYHHNAISCAK